MKKRYSFWKDRRGEMEEFAFVAPLLLLITLGLVNFGMVGVARIAAANAANYGARMGSVTQEGAAQIAASAANSVLENLTVGDYAIEVAGSGQPGSLMRVTVSYSVPNYFSALARLFGANLPSQFQGEGTASFRQEGW